MEHARPEEDSAPLNADDQVREAAARQSFFDNFRAQERSIQEVLSSVTVSTENGNLAHVHTILDTLLVRTQALEADFSQAVDMLPAYDVQRCRATLKALTVGISTKREELAPQKKFSFKRRSAPQGQPAAPPTESHVPAASSDSSSPSIAGNCPSVRVEQMAISQSGSQQEQEQKQQQQQQQSILGMEDGDVSSTASISMPALDSPQQQSIHGMEDGDVSTTASISAPALDSPRGRWADIAAEDEEEEEFLQPRTLDSACNADKPQQRQQQSVPQLQLPTVAEEETIQAQPGKTVEVSYHHLILLVVPVMPMMPFVPLAGDIEYVGPEEKEEMFKF